jgi:pimeloyl-ACP methyl ester carboxylesterase
MTVLPETPVAPVPCEPEARTVSVGGIPMSGLVAEVDRPRAVIVALHGGATSSAYFDSRVHPRASLLRTGAALGFTVLALDRPGYRASAKHARAAEMATPEARAELTFRAIEAFLPRRAPLAPAGVRSASGGEPVRHGGGVFLMAHSMGCVLATRMAASERGPELLGLEIAGTGRVPHPDTAFMAMVVSPDQPQGRAGRPRRGTLREALWEPDHLFPDGADRSLPFAPSPFFEGPELRSWPADLPGLAARVRIPVHVTLAQYERAWDSGPAALADLASLFTASPRVVVAEQADAAHNLSVGWTALPYHLKVLSFAEECAIARERTESATDIPPSTHNPLSGG